MEIQIRGGIIRRVAGIARMKGGLDFFKNRYEGRQYYMKRGYVEGQLCMMIRQLRIEMV